MQQAASPTPVLNLIYELESPTSTASYDTGLKLFETRQSFTILCEATFANRSWNNNQTIFGVTTAWRFRIGRCTGGYPVADNVIDTTSTNYYTGFAMNEADGSSSKKRMGSVFARFSTTASATKRMAVRFDHTTRRVEANSNNGSTTVAPSNRWWIFDSNFPVISDTIKFNMGSAGSTVNIFKVYDGVMTDAQINDFLNGVTD